jgi:hypothetical protein
MHHEIRAEPGHWSECGRTTSVASANGLGRPQRSVLLFGKTKQNQMPAGPAPLGLVYFATIKLVGYTAAASFIKRRLPESSASPWFVGGVRTVIGLVAGFGAVLAASKLGILRSEAGFYLLLAPIRICEWLLLLGLFYRRPDWEWARSFKLAVAGTLWSYLLDIPAVAAIFVIPGGAWIC